MLWMAAAHAYYFPPAPDEMLREATSILDATVVRFDDGEAVLDIHQVLAGHPVSAIDKVHHTCIPASVDHYGVRAGQRYVFLLYGDDLFEEQSYFEVRGDLEVRFWTGDSHTTRRWQPVGDVRRAIATARGTR